MKGLHKLLTNTTSLVGYIAVLMFIGAYLAGDQTLVANSALLKGSILENAYHVRSENTNMAMARFSGKSIVIMMDGRQYEAQIIREIEEKPVFTY